jgi:hypothetical protein
MQFEIKKFKSFRGMEGIGFNADLWVDGVKACEIDDAANGGEYGYNWVSKEMEQKVTTHVAALPIIPSVTDMDKGLWPDGRKQDMDGFVAGIVENYENDKRFKRICKSKTVFRLATDPPDQYRTLKAPYLPQGKAWIATRYPNQQVEVLNLKYA